MHVIDTLELEKLKRRLYYHVTVAGLQSAMNEFYKEPIQISDNYLFDSNFFNQDVLVGDDGSVKVINTARHYNVNENEIYLDFIYTARDDNERTMQIIARTGLNILSGPVLPPFENVVNKLVDKLEEEMM